MCVGLAACHQAGVVADARTGDAPAIDSPSIDAPVIDAMVDAPTFCSPPDQNEPNNTIATATFVANVGPSSAYQGMLTGTMCQHDVDYFEVTTEAPYKFELYIPDQNPSLDVAQFGFADDAGQPLAIGAYTTGVGEFCFIHVEPGTYYAWIRSPSTTAPEGAYQVTLSVLTP